MKKLFLSGLALIWTCLAFAQSTPGNAPVLDLAEDTTQVTTIKDIIAVQELVSSSNSNEEHYKNVWGRNSFFNLGYNMSGNLNPKDHPSLGYIDKPIPEFKIDKGGMLQLGHSYRLHKKPIANMVQFNLDYTYIDLNVNHYKHSDDIVSYKPYPENENNDGGHSTYGRNQTKYIPWGAGKYEVNYAMTLGPSITIAPFTYLNIPQLHFVKLNFYFHYGYQVALLGMMYNDDDKTKEKWNTDCLNIGHGVVQGLGLSLSWKSIGIGWETRSAKPTYQSLSKDLYGDEKYKFKSSASRLYLTIRY